MTDDPHAYQLGGDRLTISESTTATGNPMSMARILVRKSSARSIPNSLLLASPTLDKHQTHAVCARTDTCRQNRSKRTEYRGSSIKRRNQKQEFVNCVTLHFLQKEHHILSGDGKNHVKCNNRNHQGAEKQTVFLSAAATVPKKSD